MAHAVLSPSGAERWLNCTPSARLEQKFPDKGSVFASEGTLAHKLGELLICRSINPFNEGPIDDVISDIKADEQYTESMLEYCDDYATYVLEKYTEAQQHTSDALIFLEQRLNLTDYVPEGFGTGDCIIIADGTLELIDLKYGKGVPVNCERNKQMMLYALGALREFDFMYDIQNVCMTIYQPRIGNISSWEISVTELRQWAEDVLKATAALAFAGEGEYVPGKHCQFCKAKATCKAIADYNLELAKHEFADANLLQDTDVSEILFRSKMFTDWLEAVEEYALDQAVNHNKKWPGYKVVEGRANRKYSDENKVAEKLKEVGFGEDMIYKKSLLSITAMEQAISKKTFQLYLTDLIIKPQGKPTLVPESDKRPEFNSAESAAKDFA